MDGLGSRIRSARKKAGLTQKAIADHFGIDRVNVTQWENETTRPDAAKLPGLAQLLGISLDTLMSDEPVVANGTAPTPRPEPNVRFAPEAPEFPQRHEMAKDVPVWGTAQGGDRGAFILNGEQIDLVRRPPGLKDAKGLFALYTASDSMYPKFEHGELIYASTARQPAPGDHAIIEMHPEEGEQAGPGFVKKFVAQRGNKIITEQYNPPGEVEFDQREVKAMYRVYPNNELFGV